MMCEKCDHLERALMNSNNPWVKKIYWRLFRSVLHDPNPKPVYCNVCGLKLDHKESDKEADNLYRMIRI